MVEHWLRTPVNGYLGSGYGQDLKAILQRPMADAKADEQVDKLRGDVPIIGALPAGSVNLYAADVGIDQKSLLVEIGGQVFQVPG